VHQVGFIYKINTDTVSRKLITIRPLQYVCYSINGYSTLAGREVQNSLWRYRSWYSNLS